jgi:hypothetical protein
MPARPSQHPALAWRKSRASKADGGCVEVAREGPSVLVRDSRNRDMVLAFPAAQWTAFLRCVRNDKELSESAFLG